jgi:hypothetical protein
MCVPKLRRIDVLGAPKRHRSQPEADELIPVAGCFEYNTTAMSGMVRNLSLSKKTCLGLRGGTG